MKKITPVSFRANGHQNIERHLHNIHQLEDPTGRQKRKRSSSAISDISSKQRRIDDILKLNTSSPRKQAMVNALKLSFNRNHFQKLLINWIIESNLPFRTIEQPRLRELLIYSNPLIQQTNALITHSTVRRILVSEFE